MSGPRHPGPRRGGTLSTHSGLSGSRLRRIPGLRLRSGSPGRTALVSHSHSAPTAGPRDRGRLPDPTARRARLGSGPCHGRGAFITELRGGMRRGYGGRPGDRNDEPDPRASDTTAARKRMPAPRSNPSKPAPCSRRMDTSSGPPRPGPPITWTAPGSRPRTDRHGGRLYQPRPGRRRHTAPATRWWTATNSPTTARILIPSSPTAR